MSEITTEIQVTLNGEQRAIASGTTIAELLREMGFDPLNPKGIAVAVNDEVVLKGRWSTSELGPSDRIEVITALQGG